MTDSLLGIVKRRRTTDEWLTPREILDALGGADSFDLDPSSPIARPFPTARHHYTIADNGLILPWFGRVFMNPPYGRTIGRWLGRMAAHNRGVSLIFARTDTEAFFRHVWDVATAVLFVRGRVNFLRVDGTTLQRKDGSAGDGGAPSVVCAYGAADAEILADCRIDGQFVPLRIPRGVAVALALDEESDQGGTWREVLVAALRDRRGAVALGDLYRDLARHPKARANPNYQAKIRQVLQRGPFRRVARGQWQAAA